MRRRIVLLLAFAVLLGGFAGCSGCNPHAEDINEATKMSDAWVKLIDQGDYSDAWDQTGAQFKKMVGKDAWAKQIDPFRKSLGPLNTRTVESATYTDSIEGATPGKYVIIKYTSSFKRKPATLEEITAQKEDDGVWRSLGYYIR
jgi:hypothetical protein